MNSYRKRLQVDATLRFCNALYVPPSKTTPPSDPRTEIHEVLDRRGASRVYLCTLRVCTADQWRDRNKRISPTDPAPQRLL